MSPDAGRGQRTGGVLCPPQKDQQHQACSHGDATLIGSSGRIWHLGQSFCEHERLTKHPTGTRGPRTTVCCDLVRFYLDEETSEVVKMMG